MTTILVAVAIVASLFLGTPTTSGSPAATDTTTPSGTDALSGNGPPG